MLYRLHVIEVSSKHFRSLDKAINMCKETSVDCFGLEVSVHFLMDI